MDSLTLRGTWPGGPAVEDIRRRVVVDTATEDSLADEVFSRTQRGFDWLRPIETRPVLGLPRTIKVMLWYEEKPVRADPSLQAMDPWDRLPRLPGSEQEGVGGPADGSE